MIAASACPRAARAAGADLSDRESGGSPGSSPASASTPAPARARSRLTLTLTLTGARLMEVLKSQWCGQEFARILQPSASVTYTWSAAAAAAALGQPCEAAENPVSDLRIAGEPVTAEASYRVTVNSFLADGGDRFAVLLEGADRTGGAVDLQALESYLEPTITGEPLTVPATDRITVVP